MPGFLLAAIARSRGMSSERFHKAYYRYGIYISIPFIPIIYIIIYSSSETSAAPCYALIFIAVLIEVVATYMAWRKCSGKDI